MLPVLLVFRVLWSCYWSRSIVEDEGQSLYFSDNKMCTAERFSPLSSFCDQNSFAKETRFNDSKLHLHIVQWYFATLITLSNIIGNYHIRSPSYVTWRHNLLNYLKKQTNKILEAQGQHHHKPVSFSSEITH